MSGDFGMLDIFRKIIRKCLVSYHQKPCEVIKPWLNDSATQRIYWVLCFFSAPLRLGVKQK